MIECHRVRRELAALASGELDEGLRKKVQKHLDSCPACRREMSGFREVMRNAGALETDIEREMESVDWAAQAERITRAAWGAGRRLEPGGGRLRTLVFAPRLRGVLAGLALGAIVGGAATLMILKGSLVRRPGGDRYYASAEFLERVDLEIARRETLDYLERSQEVLVDIVSPGAGGSAAAVGRARELLAKKKFLNAELEKARMAKAREICDQIELLFYELADVSSSLTEDQRAELRSLVEKKDLLLKIRLLKKEIQESEV